MAADAENSTLVLVSAYCSSPHTFPVFLAWFLLYALCSPVFLSALHVLYRKWRSPRPLGHSDVFVAHLVLMELLHVLGSCLGLYSVHRMVRGFVSSLSSVLSFTSRSGRLYIHDLTCLERYLAVVHPITYLRLKKGAGAALRNVLVGMAWVSNATLASLALKADVGLYFLMMSLTLALLSFTLTSCCTAAVLCVLIRPGPGEGGGDRRSVSRSKRAALNTMAFLLVAQMIHIVNGITFCIVGILAPDGVDLCFVFVNSLWLEFPNILVLPLLYLHRPTRQRHETTPRELRTKPGIDQV